MLEILGASADVVNAGYNIYKGEQQAKFEKEKFNYQKSMDKKIMEREDTALQRQMEDARRAGLSALAVTGGADAGSTSVSSGSIDPNSNPYDDTSTRDYLAMKETKRANKKAEQIQEEEMNLRRDKNEADIASIKSQTINNNQEQINRNNESIAKINKLISDTKNSDVDYELKIKTLNDQIDSLKLSNENLSTQNTKLQEDIAKTGAETRKTEAETRKTEAEAETAEQKAKEGPYNNPSDNQYYRLFGTKPVENSVNKNYKYITKSEWNNLKKEYSDFGKLYIQNAFGELQINYKENGKWKHESIPKNATSNYIKKRISELRK